MQGALGYEDSRLWRQTMVGVEGSETRKATEALAHAYHQFRQHVIPLAKDISISVPGYTDHSIEHCDALWDTASMLTAPDFPLNPAEAFVLGGAFLVHDLGMGLPAYQNGLAEITSNTDWRDLLAMLHPEDHEAIQRTIKADIASNPTWAGLSDNRSKEVLTYYLRLNHADQAEKIMHTHWELSNKEQFFLLPDTHLRHWYGELIGKLGRSHWVDVDSLPEMFPQNPGAIPGYPIEWTIDPVKLACLLRLADATQIDARRANPLHTPHRNPQGISKAHWVFQEQFLSPQIHADRLVYTSAGALTPDQAEAWWLAYDTARMIDQELRKVDALCGDLGKPRFKASSVAGVESPNRFATFVPVKDWRPIDASPRISDSTHVIATLGGENLYGAHTYERTVFLRELLANALDATRARRLAFSGDEEGFRPVRVSLESLDTCDRVVIRDYGIGMDEESIANDLCDFGKSGWRKRNMANRFPGILANDFSPAGMFGIGFFSVFMVSDHVLLRTRSIEGRMDDTFYVEFAGGLQRRPIVRKAHPSERLSESGTEIVITLKKRFTEQGGIFEQVQPSDISDNALFSSDIRRLALMADEDIQVRAVGCDDFAYAVRRDEWRNMSGEELFDSMNGNTHRVIPGEVLSTLRSAFSRTVKPIADNKGNVVGKLGLNIGFREYNYYTMYAETSSVYCGGLDSRQGCHYFGVIEGVPTRARRDQARVKLGLDDFQRWFRMQRDLLGGEAIHPEEALSLQAEGLRLGVRSDDLPITYGELGYLTPLQFREYCAGLDAIHLMDPGPETLLLGEEVHVGGRTHDDRIGLPKGSQFFCTYSTRIYFPEEELLPFRPNEHAENWKDHTRTSPIFDPVEWWRYNFASCEAELIRILGEAWDTPTAGLIESITKCEHRYGDSDTRVIVPCLGGGEARMDALRVTRPK